MTGHRQFTDEKGEVWDVVTIVTPHGPVTPKMENGWTSFRSSTEVRRITPARGVEHVTEQELRTLLAEARPCGPPRRLTE